MFFFLYKTQCLVDGSAYFGVQASSNVNWNEDNKVVGGGLKLQQKINQFGRHRFRTSIEFCSTERDLVMKRLDDILSPQTLAHPLCLNGDYTKPKSEEHKENMAIAKIGNTNAFGHAKSEETKEELSKRNLALKMKWIHNPTTGEEMQMPKDEIEECGIITGFVLGRAPAEVRKKFKQRS